ncbi:hypothetical protein [Magnetospirillum aberrantis]|uniref:Uncharacterized protein n=1 Tax=Magnetospirillum aberrantis SpK TaxID=908842 RepID=A0A7C9QTA6_9PROT|nr:hypothetical protein [Magnetospirillum aberrantis]NFV80004.1 hypothetical protein [Magnetospirillum aberrantis SpK]
MFSLTRDLAAEIAAVYAAAHASATAGGTGDNTEVTGVTIDLQGLGNRFGSVAFVFAATATLAATKTLTVAAEIETGDASDMSDAADLVTSSTVLTLTGATGGSTETGTAKLGVSLEYAKRYIRIKYTPNLSATGTDTAAVQAVAIFGGAERLPVA